MGLRAYLRQIWRYLLFIVIAVAVSATIAFVVTSSMQKTYTATSTLVVTAGLGTDASGTGDVLTAPRIGQTYAVLATTRPILLEVIRQANLPYDPTALLTHLSVTAELDSPFLSVVMNDPDRTRAAATANALADVLVAKASVPAAGAIPAQVLLQIVERAPIPETATGPRVLFNTILAAAAALVLALVIVSFATYFRDDPARPTETA